MSDYSEETRQQLILLHSLEHFHKGGETHSARSSDKRGPYVPWGNGGNGGGRDTTRWLLWVRSVAKKTNKTKSKQLNQVCRGEEERGGEEGQRGGAAPLMSDKTDQPNV